MKNIMKRQELVNAGFPFGKVANDTPLGDPETEWQRTNPDVVVYKPEKNGTDHNDNCVLGATVTKDEKEILLFWTQSSVECFGDNRIVMTRSSDGVNWSEPRYIIGARNQNEKQASWAMPMLTQSGRIYLVYICEVDNPDGTRVESGDLTFVYTDDNGYTWSAPGSVSLPRSIHDNPDSTKAKNWWNWQKPIRDKNGRFIMGFTTQISNALINKTEQYPSISTWVSLLRINNLDENPEPQDIEIDLLPVDGVSIPDKHLPDIPVAQEPSTVLLPDGRIFCSMRTMSGYACYSVYDDVNGLSEPRPIEFSNGEKMMHPLGPVPMYRLADGRYIIFFNNNDGVRMGFSQYSNFGNGQVRNPYYIAIGKYDPKAKQPIQFEDYHLFIDTDDVAVCPRKQTVAASMYSCITEWKGKCMIWYPDRKYYVLGKELKL